MKSSNLKEGNFKANLMLTLGTREGNSEEVVFYFKKNYEKIIVNRSGFLPYAGCCFVCGVIQGSESACSVQHFISLHPF